MTPAQIQHRFDCAIRSNFAWTRKAQQLYTVGLRTLEDVAAAKPKAEITARSSGKLSPEEDSVFEEYMLYEVGFFLIALAVENLLKALWVGKHYLSISGVENIRRDLRDLAQHDLNAIAESAGLNRSADEVDLMETLKQCILWHGRYPTPTRRQDYGAQFLEGTPLNRFFEGGSIFGLQLPLP